MYYLRTGLAAWAIQFTVDQGSLEEVKQQKTDTAKAKAQANGIRTPISSTAVPPSTPVNPVAIKQEPVTYLWLPLLHLQRRPYQRL